VNHLVLSGTATHVPSGTKTSCYRGPESRERVSYSTAWRVRNFSNRRILRILSNWPAVFWRRGQTFVTPTGGVLIVRLLELAKRVVRAVRACHRTRDQVQRDGEAIVTVRAFVTLQRSDASDSTHQVQDPSASPTATSAASSQRARHTLAVVWRGPVASGVSTNRLTQKTCDTIGGAR
jgi:hypothetical protein